MAYKNNIPQPSDNLSVSQNDILNNFAQLDTTMGVNHFNFSDVSGNTGKHTFVEMVALSGTPTIAAGEDAIYSITSSSISDIYMTADTGGKSYQLSRVRDSQFSTFGQFKNNYTPQGGGGAQGADFTAGWTFLPGNLFFQYGFYNHGSIPSGSYIPVKFPITFSNANKIIVYVTPLCKAGGTSESHTPSVDYSTIGVNGFTCNYDTSTSSYIGFSWQAIGF